jgi:hypothetical protein
VAGATAALAAACNDPGESLNDPAYRPATLATSSTGPAYPKGPYDVAKGAVIPNGEFEGFSNAKLDNSALEPISLADFYNPHADDPSYAPASPDVDDRLFPPGSRYGAGEKKPLALFIDIGSVWCGPCNNEAKTQLPGLHARWKPCGGEIFFQLIESASPGSPATEGDLRAWTKGYKVDYPAMLDPGRQLGKLYPSNSFPAAAIVDTRTMRLVDVSQALPTDAFVATFEGLLDQACLAKH